MKRRAGSSVWYTFKGQGTSGLQDSNQKAGKSRVQIPPGPPYKIFYLKIILGRTIFQVDVHPPEIVTISLYKGEGEAQMVEGFTERMMKDAKVGNNP